MLAPTHATFGLMFTILTGTVFGLGLTPSVAAFAVLGALLPDLDTPTSLIGKLGFPIARALERRFGHRTATHSLLGCAAFTLPTVPLALVNPHWPMAFGLGYLSHLLIDCANKSGAPLFYPSPIRAVLPKSETFRVTVGSRAERGVLVGLLLALAVLVPLHRMGFTRALHALTQTTAGALRDYRGWQGRFEVWVDVDGIFQLSTRRVRARYQILGVVDAATLVVLDPTTGKIHTVGTSKEANVYPYRIRAHQGRAITVRSRPVVLTQQLLSDLLREVPSHGATYFLGTVKTADTAVVQPDPEQYEVLKVGVQELELRYARPRDLREPRLGTLFVLTGQALVQTILPEGQATPGPGSPARPPEFDDVTELFIPHLTDPGRELRIREGERVRRGQLLARLGYKDPELERRRRDAEARLDEKVAALALQEGKVRQVRALVMNRLAAAGALDREEAALLRAREAAAKSRRDLEQVIDSARRASEIRAPVEGQVLTVRVHVIHGSESTAVVRFLYRRADDATKPRVPDVRGQ